MSLLILSFLLSCKHHEKSGETKEKKSKTTSATKKKNSQTKVIQDKKSNPNDLKTILGISNKEIRSNKLYSFIDEWYGVPYKYGGCKKTGVDCSCFINILYEQVYKEKIANTAADIYKTCDKITLENAHEGDFVFFKINGNNISHIGVLLKNKNFVHASTSSGVMVSSLDEAYFKKFFHSAGRIKNT